MMVASFNKSMLHNFKSKDKSWRVAELSVFPKPRF